MSSYNSTSSFRVAIGDLTRRAQDGYSSCEADICNELKGLDFGSIWELKPLLQTMKDVRIIKVRLKNSQQNLSKSEGYRLIILADRRTETVTFLTIFPKIGRLAKNTLTAAEMKEEVLVFANEAKSKHLRSHDIHQQLIEISSNPKINE